MVLCRYGALTNKQHITQIGITNASHAKDLREQYEAEPSESLTRMLDLVCCGKSDLKGMGVEGDALRKATIDALLEAHAAKHSDAVAALGILRQMRQGNIDAVLDEMERGVVVPTSHQPEQVVAVADSSQQREDGVDRVEGKASEGQMDVEMLFKSATLGAWRSLIMKYEGEYPLILMNELVGIIQAKLNAIASTALFANDKAFCYDDDMVLEWPKKDGDDPVKEKDNKEGKEKHKSKMIILQKANTKLRGLPYWGKVVVPEVPDVNMCDCWRVS